MVALTGVVSRLWEGCADGLNCSHDYVDYVPDSSAVVEPTFPLLELQQLPSTYIRTSETSVAEGLRLDWAVGLRTYRNEESTGFSDPCTSSRCTLQCQIR
jgi:hypothetical protein